MWFDNIWNISPYWWLLILAVLTLVTVAPFILKKPKKDPLKKQMEYFCKCYARGEISQEDFNELKKDLYNYKLNSTEGTIKKKQMHKHIN